MADPNVLHLAEYRSRCGALSVRQACLPAGVDPIDQEKLDAIVRRKRHLDAGAQLFRMGDPMTALYVSRRGAFKATAVSQDGAEQILAFYLPGELMGLDGLGRGYHRCDTIALEPTEVCELDFDELLHTAASLPRLRAQLHRVVGQKIGRDADHAAMLTRKLAHERVAGFFDDLIDRYCLLGSQGTAFRLPMSRDDIARFLGLTLETVSRSVTRLQDDGVLQARGRQIEIQNPAALARLARGAA